MGVFARLRRSHKTILVYIFGSALFLYSFMRIFVHEQTPKRRLFAYDQQIDELFSNSPLFNGKEVTESDVRLWQGKFYSSLESAISKRLTKRGTALAVYACNQSHLRDINQITLPGNESRQAVETISQNGLMHFMEKASCKPRNPDVVLYNRIFKTGSETTRALFSFVAAMIDYSYTKETKEQVYDYDQGQLRAYEEIIEHKVNQADRQVFFNAHFKFRNNLKIQRTHTYINQIRHPVDRYISSYAYVRSTNRAEERVKKMIETGEFNDTIEQCFEKQGIGCKYNVMTRFFCGTEDFCMNDTEKALARAKENILNHYAAVGLLEHFVLTLKIIQRRLPYFLPVLPEEPTHFKLNKGTNKFNSSCVSKEMIEKIKQANWLDIELYEFVKEIFWKQVKACGIL